MAATLPWPRPSAVSPIALVVSESLRIPTRARMSSRSSFKSSQRLLSGVLGGLGRVLALQLSPKKFRSVWVVIVATHAVCSGFLACTACMFWYLSNPAMVYFVHLWAPTVGNRDYALYGAAFALVGVLHAARALQLTHRSIQAKRLLFRRKISPRARSPATARLGSSLLKYPRQLTRRMSEAHQHKLNLWARTMKRVWRSLFSKRGLFGVESEHFFTIFVLRELIELATQTYQVYQSSYLLPVVWLSNFMVAMLVTNCWSTLVMGQFFAKTPALERVVVLTTDAYICIFMSIVIPSTIVAPLVASFDLSHFMFKDPDRSYDPEFMTAFIMKNQLVFASGLVDLSAKLIPHLTVFSSLVTISELIARRPGPVTSVGIPPPRTTIKTATICTSPAQPVLPRSYMKWVHVAIKITFCAWGAIVLGLHLHAASLASSHNVAGCRASTRPWLSSGASCSSLVVNCHALNVSSPEERSFAQITAPALATITFAHCPALRMPSALQKFTNLMYVYLYNSTVVEWDDASSISASAHGRLFTIGVARSRFPKGFPEGLLHALPPALISIQFCVTDLASLPDDLHLRWHPLASVAFEFGELTDFPASLISLRTATLSLQGNRLQKVSSLAAMAPDLVVPQLLLDDNPLIELPDSFGSPTDFFVGLELENTLVASLPEWTRTQVLGLMYMYGTPYCATTASESRQHNVQCEARSNGEHQVEFPLHMIDKLYALDQVQ